jgi:hypothetical protein
MEFIFSGFGCSPQFYIFRTERTYLVVFITLFLLFVTLETIQFAQMKLPDDFQLFSVPELDTAECIVAGDYWQPTPYL